MQIPRASEGNNFEMAARPLKPLWYNGKYFKINALTLHISESMKITFSFISRIVDLYICLKEKLRIIYLFI